MRIQEWWHDKLNNIILNPKHSLQNLSGAERVETLVSEGNPRHMGEWVFKQLQMLLVEVD